MRRAAHYQSKVFSSEGGEAFKTSCANVAHVLNNGGLFVSFGWEKRSRIVRSDECETWVARVLSSGVVVENTIAATKNLLKTVLDQFCIVIFTLVYPLFLRAKGNWLASKVCLGD